MGRDTEPFWNPGYLRKGGGRRDTGSSFVLPDQKPVGARMAAPLGVTLSDLRERDL